MKVSILSVFDSASYKSLEEKASQAGPGKNLVVTSFLGGKSEEWLEIDDRFKR